jgi:hypothetical protein
MLYKRDFSTANLYCGIAMAASMPIIITTTKSSISVNAFSFLILFTSLSFSPFCKGSVALAARDLIPALKRLILNLSSDLRTFVLKSPSLFTKERK